MPAAISAKVASLVQARPDLTIAGLRERLAVEGGVEARWSMVRRWLLRLGLRLKKTLHAVERDTEANRKRREEFVQRLRSIPPEKLIYRDESGVTVSMTRLWGRCAGGRRLHEATPGGHWKVLTILGAMSTRGMIAAMTIEEPTDGDIFSRLSRTSASPALRLGDVVVMDNLSAHRKTRRRAALSAALLPGFEPHRKGLGQAQTLLRSAKARTREGLNQAIADLLPKIAPENAQAWFRLRFGTLQQCDFALLPAQPRPAARAAQSGRATALEHRNQPALEARRGHEEDQDRTRMGTGPRNLDVPRHMAMQKEGLKAPCAENSNAPAGTTAFYTAYWSHFEMPLP